MNFPIKSSAAERGVAKISSIYAIDDAIVYVQKRLLLSTVLLTRADLAATDLAVALIPRAV